MHNIHLDQFEGPLDLLLYFIRRDEIDIYDIPISKITYDYLNVIDKMNSLNVSIAGEFVLMAATLMKIKSKILIPRQELDEEGEIVDPRTDLVNKLVRLRLLLFPRLSVTNCIGNTIEVIRDKSFAGLMICMSFVVIFDVVNGVSIKCLDIMLLMIVLK